jgi:hypothetical protein
LFFVAFATERGLRVLVSFVVARALLVVLVLLLRWHPRFASGLLALPLCGAAPTFLCRRKEK